MINLPNPFEPATAPAMVAGAAAAPDLSDPPVAAADHFESRFVLDESEFMDAIEPLPLFLQQAPLHADELYPVLKLLSGY